MAAHRRLDRRPFIFARADFVSVHRDILLRGRRTKRRRIKQKLYLSGRFLHETEVEANQKQDEMDEATNSQKVRGHRSKSKERERQRNSNMIPRQIPACSSCDKKRAGQKLKNVLPDAFHSVTRPNAPQVRNWVCLSLEFLPTSLLFLRR
jgi:hypothetical protein